MNLRKEKIDIKAASCREMDAKQLIGLLSYNRPRFDSWGSHNFVLDNMKRPKMFRMLVSGNHHKGHVYIFLNFLDLFDVYLTTTQGTIIDRTEEMGLYFDQLAEWIDRKVERIPEYVR